MSALQVIPGLDPARYTRHPLHADDRLWLEKNCYIDIWIELLHALGLEPQAMLGVSVGLDFVGDQWTFLKPAHAQLWSLYGVEVQELTVWKPLLEHAQEHLAAGRMICTESDAWWLPDTAGTDYRRTHTKSSIVIESIDVVAGRMGYFHNSGYYSVDGEDFAQLFRTQAVPDPSFMPLFAEWIGVARRVSLPAAELARAARELLPGDVARMSADNPVARYAARWLDDAAVIRERGIAYYHAWAFANTRQLGASMELAQAYLQWLQAHGALDGAAAIEAASAAGRLSAGCKTLILKGARSAATGKTAGLAESLAELATDWQRLRDSLHAAL